MPFLSRISSLLIICFIAGLSLVLDGSSFGASSSLPAVEELCRLVTKAHADFKNVNEGEVFKDIPALAKVDPGLFSVAIVTKNGEVCTAGDSNHKFTIQSISKLFTLARAMQDHEENAIVEKIGVEPTGMPFNSAIAVALHKSAGNPLVNAGAMAAVSLVDATSADERWERIARTNNTFAGAKLSLNQEVYQSEAETNHRNRGIAELLFSYGRLYADPLETTDIYTKQCSVGVTTTQLATMGATLANSGINPITGERAVDAKYVPKVLAVMMMAGLYDGAGRWAWDIGLPAKTGVGGGILAVVPGKFAIAAFSPLLDKHGTSVRAALAIQDISKELGLNLFDVGK